MRHSSLGLAVLALALGFVITCANPAHADNLYASIRGTATDPSGALVSGVKMTATNIATGISYTTTTDQSGAFSFLQLPIGNYTVKGEMTGFKTFQTTGIHLDLNQVYGLNAKMELGTVSEEVIVEANPVQVESASMQLGTTVTGGQIVDLPLNGRNWTQLQQLEPGVVGRSDRFGDATNGGYSGNGAQTQQNSFLINGTDSNDVTLNTALLVPSPDAIGEFRLVTNTLNPEYGRNSGTVINAVIKNGTNQFHGSGFEFYRDAFMDAKSWFRLQASPFHQNQFGGTIGGPIVKNHAFFFFSYQGLRQRAPETDIGPISVPTVFTQAQRGGDFSATSSFNGVPGAGTGGGPLNPKVSPVPLFGDSASPCPASGGTPCAAGTPYGQFFDATNTLVSNGLFSTGVIPSSDLNALSLKLMNQFVPPPNGAGNTFLFNPITQNSDDQYLYRLDEKIREQDSIWFYGLWETNPNTDTLPFTGATLPGFAEQATRHYQQYTAAWTHTFNPTTLNEARFGYTRFNFAAVLPVNPINPTSYGFTGITPQNTSLASLPLMTVAGLFNLGFSNNGPQPRIQNVYQVVDNFSKVWGHHTLKAGFNMDRLEINNPFFNNLGGNFTFGGGGLFSTGVPGADFLLGFPDSYIQGSGSLEVGRGREYYSYFQDQWQVKKNLTLTLGVGWDIETPWVNEYKNNEIMAAFRPGQQSTVFPSMPVGFVYPGDKGINKYGGMNIHYTNFAPRAGFAWSPGTSGNWAVRGGVGLYYNRTESELTLQSLTNPPFALTTNGAGQISSPGFATPFNTANPQNIAASAFTTAVPAGTIANPFPFTPPAPGSSFNRAIFAPIGLGMTTYDPRLTSPRSTNYNLTVERQLSKSTILSVGYVGNIGRHEVGAALLNLAGQAPGVNPAAAAAGCTTGFALTSCVAPGAPGSPPFNPLALYGHPGFITTEFNSNYNSLQVQLNRHFSNGLQVLAAYTYSRYFDYTSNLENSGFNFPGINTFDVKHMYGPSANDAPQRFVVSYKYTLPFYKLGHHWKRVTDDWNVVGIYTLQHGLPVAVFDFSSTSLTCDLAVSFFACPDRANRTGAPLAIHDPRNYTIGTGTNYWFNPAAFSVPAPGTGIGNANRNPLYGPGLNYGDIALEKEIPIDESRRIELRLETFNTFNHANFQNPTTPGFNSEDVSEPASFGRIFGVQQISTNGDGRVLQLGVKFYF